MGDNSVECQDRTQWVLVPQLESVCGYLRHSKVRGGINSNSMFSSSSCTKDFMRFSSLMLGSWLFFFPESPKFLIECGETDEALEILRDMYQENSGRERSEYPVISQMK